MMTHTSILKSHYILKGQKFSSLNAACHKPYAGNYEALWHFSPSVAEPQGCIGSLRKKLALLWGQENSSSDCYEEERPMSLNLML